MKFYFVTLKAALQGQNKNTTKCIKRFNYRDVKVRSPLKLRQDSGFMIISQDFSKSWDYISLRTKNLFSSLLSKIFRIHAHQFDQPEHVKNITSCLPVNRYMRDTFPCATAQCTYRAAQKGSQCCPWRSLLNNWWHVTFFFFRKKTSHLHNR